MKIKKIKINPISNTKLAIIIFALATLLGIITFNLIEFRILLREYTGLNIQEFTILVLALVGILIYIVEFKKDEDESEEEKKIITKTKPKRYIETKKDRKR